MSSSDASHNESPPDGRGPAEPESPEEETATPSEGSPEPIECPNCGHEFTGNYCPECGQEADPSASVVEVIGGFFRELVDVESGFWPTFVGLTVRPGKVLRDYLGGVRAGLISPGRYLLAAVIVGVGVDQFLAWIGASDLPWAESEASSSSNGAETEEGLGKAIDVAVDQVVIALEGPQARIIGVLLTVGLLAVLLYRLFGDELEQIGEAVAVASFLVAHANFLSRGGDLLSVGAASLYAGQPVDGPAFLGLAIAIGYVGFAVHEGFGPGWRSAVKGGFAMICAVMEMFSVLLTAGMVYAGGLLLLYPDRYAPAELTTSEALLVSALGGLIAAVPYLLHAGIELYLRYRA